MSCSQLGWLFSSVLAHVPVAEGGPRALARVASRGSVALGCCSVGCARSRVIAAAGSLVELATARTRQ
jgi:hypothetical protein